MQSRQKSHQSRIPLTIHPNEGGFALADGHCFRDPLPRPMISHPNPSFTVRKSETKPFKQAEAERLRRAKVINAMGEQQAAEKLVEAGRILAQEPQAMQLRYFEALHDIAGERSSTVVFPLPTNLLGHLGLRSEST
jgi:hypothetical protein